MKKIKFKILLYGLIVFLLFYFLPAFSQAKLSGGGGGMQFGWGNIFLDNLNKVLYDNGMDKLPGQMFTFGGNGQGVIKNFVIGGGMYRYQSVNNPVQAGLKTASSAHYGTLNLGYILVKNRKYISYPVIGLGYSTFSLKMANQNKVEFLNALTERDQEMHLALSNAVMDIGWVFEYFPVSKNELLKGGPCIGIQVGCFFSAPSNNWEYFGGEIINGPKFGPGGFYIRSLYKGYVFHYE